MVWILLALAAFIRKRIWKETNALIFLCCSSLPLLAAVFALSLFNKTLSHWSGPGYYGLIFIAAYMLGSQKAWPAIWKRLRLSVGFGWFVIVLGVLQVCFGLLPMPVHPDPERLGTHDFTLDIFGWQQLSQEFDAVVSADQCAGRVGPDVVLVTGNWFPAGQIDYYLGFRKNRSVLVEGEIGNQHQYRMINARRGGFEGLDALYFLATSRYPYYPSAQLQHTHQVEDVYTIAAKRMQKPVYYLYVYRLKRISDNQ